MAAASSHKLCDHLTAETTARAVIPCRDYVVQGFHPQTRHGAQPDWTCLGEGQQRRIQGQACQGVWEFFDPKRPYILHLGYLQRSTWSTKYLSPKP